MLQEIMLTEPHKDTDRSKPPRKDLHKLLMLRRLEQKIDILMMKDLLPILQRNNPVEQSDDPDDYLGLPEVAELFRVSQKTIYNWIYLGRIPYHKATGRLLFNRSDMQQMLKKKNWK